MEPHFLVPKLLFCLLMVKACCGDVLFSSLPQALLVSASPKQGQVLKAGEDNITVTWSRNPSSATAAKYEYVKAFLCYAPISQVDRPWRKTVDNLSKDKTCQFTIFSQSYDSSITNRSVHWMIAKNIPEATYFIRAYAYDSSGQEVAYGQTSNAKKTENLFEINAITGIHWRVEVLSICGSAFPLLSLFGLTLWERSKIKGVPTS